MRIMKMDDITLNIKKLIKSDAFFENINVISAFPDKMKSTRLKQPVIAIGIDNIEMASDRIDESSRRGDICVFADIFLPTQFDIGMMEKIFSKLCTCFDSFNILSIKTGRSRFDSYAQAYVLDTVFTFNDNIEFGSENDE